jgi:hypothetical protein
MSATHSVEVVPVHSPRLLSAFVEVPKRVYADDRAWIPPLDFERRLHLNGKKNPFFEHAEAQLFVALADGNPLGRISAHIDRLHLERYGDATGHFGFLEAIDRPQVFTALLSRAESWLRERRLVRIQGPFNFSINDECGLLIEGFDSPPAILMGHARPYYAKHLRAAGYLKAKDLIAYRHDMRKPLPRALTAMLAKGKNSGRLKVRPFSKRHFERDLAIIVDIFNDAWAENWSFVPMTASEARSLGNVLRFLLSQRHVAIASYDGSPAAMIVTLPDFNLMYRDLNGRLLPFGWAKLLWRIMMETHEAVRVPLLGVKSQYRTSPVGTILALSLIEAVHLFHLSRGTERCELSWILEDNMPMRRLIEAVGADAVKTYRIYEKNLV